MKPFDNEIIALENEIKNLKIQKQLSVSQLKTKEYVVPMHWEFYKKNNYTITSKQIYDITITPKNNVAPMISVRLDVDSFDDRNWWILENFDSSSEGGYNPEKNLVSYRWMLLMIRSDNQSDWDSLNNGNPVYLDFNFIITCSSEIDVDVETREY